MQQMGKKWESLNLTQSLSCNTDPSKKMLFLSKLESYQLRFTYVDASTLWKDKRSNNGPNLDPWLRVNMGVNVYTCSSTEVVFKL